MRIGKIIASTTVLACTSAVDINKRSFLADADAHASGHLSGPEFKHLLGKLLESVGGKWNCDSACLWYVKALEICVEDPDPDFCQNTLPEKVNTYLQMHVDVGEVADYIHRW